MIKEIYKIEDQIKISYKCNNSFYEIDDSINIDEIRDCMVEKGSNRKSQNFLYINIQNKIQRSKSDQIKMKDELIKKSKNSSSSDNDDYAINSLRYIKFPKKPVARKTIPIIFSSSSSEDEKPPKKLFTNVSSTKKKKPPQEE